MGSLLLDLFVKIMKKGLIAFLSFFAPAIAFAQNPTQLYGLLDITRTVINWVVPIVVTLGVIYFIWAVIQYVTVKDEEERAKSKSHMIYGIIGLFVVVSIWGLIQFLGTTLGISSGAGQGYVPCVNDLDNNPANGCQ